MDSGETSSEVDKTQVLEHLQRELMLLQSLRMSPEDLEAARRAQAAKRAKLQPVAAADAWAR